GGGHLRPGRRVGLAAEVHHGRGLRRLPPLPRSARPPAGRRDRLAYREDGRPVMSEPAAPHSAREIPLRREQAGADETDTARDDPLAAALAFLRRRITGDYEVDEFGF